MPEASRPVDPLCCVSMGVVNSMFINTSTSPVYFLFIGQKKALRRGEGLVCMESSTSLEEGCAPEDATYDLDILLLDIFNSEIFVFVVLPVETAKP